MVPRDLLPKARKLQEHQGERETIAFIDLSEALLDLHSSSYILSKTFLHPRQGEPGTPNAAEERAMLWVHRFLQFRNMFQKRITTLRSQSRETQYMSFTNTNAVADTVVSSSSDTMAICTCDGLKFHSLCWQTPGAHTKRMETKCNPFPQQKTRRKHQAVPVLPSYLPGELLLNPETWCVCHES